MTWLQIVLALVEALPNLIRDIEAIVEALTNQSAAVQAAAKHDLTLAIKTKNADEMKKAVDALKT